MDEEKKFGTKENIICFIEEFGLCGSLMSMGIYFSKGNILMVLLYGLFGILFLGFYTMDVSKYNLKPFFYSWLPKKLK